MATLLAAAIQFPVRPGLVEANCELVLARLAEAAQRGAELAVLPELWTTGGEHVRPRLEAERSAVAVSAVRRAARQHRIIVVGSSLAHEGGRFFDQAHVVDADGRDAGTYRRVHRCAGDVGLISTGDTILAVQTSRAKVGVLIGADVEFPEQAVALALERARLLAVCASWRVEEADVARALLTARAIESQSFVVAATSSTARPADGARGGSVVLGPGGVLLAQGGTDDEIVMATIDLDAVNEIRRSRPLARRRAPAAYAEAIATAPLARMPEEEAAVPVLGRILTRDEMARESVHLHAQGRTLVFTNGCFDILHLGHVRYLEDARRLGDALCVGVNTDGSVRGLGKGDDRPVQTEKDRAAILASLRCVDYVVLFDEPTPLELIRAVQPDVLVKGGDWKPENVVGADVVMARGGKVVIADFVPGHSTTGVIERIRSSIVAEARGANPEPVR